MTDDARRSLPSVARLVTEPMVERWGRLRCSACARSVIAAARARVVSGEGAPELGELRRELHRRLDVGVVPVINATGVVLHTNLGRAPWSESAVQAAIDASGYALLELDGATGKRGVRGAGVEDRICALTGAEAAIVVNNGAAAVLLALAGLAEGGRVGVSRSQLVEIGGGFRIPEILSLSGAQLAEVGTTNRTHVPDYQRALAVDPRDEPESADNTSNAVLFVHSSNFRQIGFTTAPSLSELASLGETLIADLGSGALEPIADEPALRDAVNVGVDVVCFSGDKLLGGPQAGIAIGKAACIERMRRHPLARALRPGKVTLAALEGTLDDWLRRRPVPTHRMVQASLEDLRLAVESWRSALPRGVAGEVVEVSGAIGGGSLPGRRWPSVALAITDPSPARLHAALLAGEPKVIARIKGGRLLLDARTVAPLGRSEALKAALLRALDSLG